jgi:hypothetical protein
MKAGGTFERLEEHSLLVPNMHWRIDHHYQPLQGKVKDSIAVVVEAFQSVQFKLDRFGAGVISSARFPTWDNGGPHPQQFHFDRPFLLYMKKRGAAHPFLMMWIENGELLEPF